MEDIQTMVSRLADIRIAKSKLEEEERQLLKAVEPMQMGGG